MTTIDITTVIDASTQRCFDLARSIDAHLESAQGTGERVVGGKTTGLMGLGDEVTWEARHLGIRQRLTSKITAFEPPTYFQDRMTRGAFRSFEHDHHFTALPSGTTQMRDTVRFSAPFGPLGWIVEHAVLKPHLTRFLLQRAERLKLMAQSSTTIPKTSPT